MANKKKSPGLNLGWKVLFGLVGLGLLAGLFFLVFGHQGLTHMQRLQTRLENAKVQNEKLMQENIALLQQIDHLREDKAYIEHIARRDLNLVRPDETIIEIQR